MNRSVPETAAWMPLFLRMRGRWALVVGGGIEADRKVARLLRHGARVDVFADALSAELRGRAQQGRVRWVASLPDPAPDYRVVIIAERTGDARTRALALAERRGIPVNVVDEPDHCTAIMPAIVDRSPITIAIGSGGTAPELARKLRSRIEALLPDWTGRLAQLADDRKARIRERFPDLPRRRQFLDWLFTGPPAEAIARNEPGQARALAARALDDADFRTPGSVALVGAGPGDPELLTVKALRLIQEADAIVHDALVDARVLEFARRDAELHDVGKRGGRCSTPQLAIHTLLLELVGDGKRVVRLKGGDSMVFGRGGEELEFLRAHEIEYSVVPGITAAAGCAATAGIPLTHRDHAQSVHLITAHGCNSIDRLDWPSLARERQTLAFYMAVSRLDTVRSNLLRHGRDPATPVALVENGTRPEQRVLTGTLDRLHALARTHRVHSPAMLYVGEVAQLADRLSWWGEPPLMLESVVSAQSAFDGHKLVGHG